MRISLQRISVAAVVAALVAVPAALAPPDGAPAAAATAHVARVLPKKPRLALRPQRRPRPRQAQPSVVREIVPNDPLWQSSWALERVGARAAWRVTSGVAQTIVAVLDTGVDRSHPDLQGAVLDGYDVVNRDFDATDDHGHGTMVAGVIAARADNGIGGVGACWRCSVLPVKVIGANGVGTAADISEGITWATDHGASVINLSFTMSGPDVGITQAIEFAQSKGVLVVAAAGNTGNSEPSFPASLPSVLSVTATDPADARFEWATYGNWVRLAAPGCSQSTQAGGGYADFCGTSSAAAFASGIAALAHSVARGPSAGEVVEALSAHSVRVGDFVTAGRIDAAAAVGALASPGEGVGERAAEAHSATPSSTPS